jgi:delta14-sterol reductase
MQGAVLADGTRVTYTLNGLALFLTTAGGLGALHLTGAFSLATVARLYLPLLVVANIIAFGQTFALYVKGVRAGAKRRPGLLGAVKDAFYGLELNPSLWGQDLKMFAYRPSLIGLAVLNASFAALQWEQHGTLSGPMIAYQIMTFAYVFNYFQFEHGMLHTWDIIAEDFGWMLVWGDYVLVPFFYCVSGLWLIDAGHSLPAWVIVGLLSTWSLGMWIFRGANEQKDRFKRDPGVRIWGRPAETLGGRILVSGFWGVGRKLNYTGEIMVYVSWTLLTGFQSFVPWLLPGWLFCLLVHRAWRDEQRCAAKYGPLWEQYRQRARFRMFPFIY